MVIQKEQGMASSYDCEACSCPAGFSSLSVAPVTFGIIPTAYRDMSDTATYHSCNGSGNFYYNVTSASSWANNNTPVIQMNSSIHYRAVGQSGGTANVNGCYTDCSMYDNNPDLECPCISWRTYCNFGGGSVTSVGCSTATRGQTATCSVSNPPAGATFSNWKFTVGTTNVTTTSTNSSWSGTAVKSGTVSVKVTSGGMAPTLTASLTVNARNWHTGSASPVEVANGTFYTLPVPPQPTGTDSGLGIAREQTGDQGFNYFTVGSGPNSGFTYINTQPSISTVFQYEINPDLENSGSIFSTKQYGNCGFISWSNLLAQTRRHEYNSTTQSHYAFYKNSLNLVANNPGDFFEQQFAAPNTDLISWASNVVRSGANSRYNQIFAETFGVEPFPVNDSETGTFLGNINYVPYASCP
jgi:hypothetical protein